MLGVIQALLMVGTLVSVTAMCIFSILMPMKRKPGSSVLVRLFLNPWDCVFVPSRLTEEGRRYRKLWFISAAVALFFVVCDAVALWTHPI